MSLCGLSAVELARRLRVREVSARDVVGAHLTQIERVNPGLNAIVTLVADQALDHARQADEDLAHGRPVGPLHGLPIAHKDLQATKGIRTTFGSPIFKDFVPAEDSLIVERLRQAGAIVVGKTNTPEFGAGSQTFNPVFGRRQRHGRLAPQSRELLRHRRHAAVAGTRAGMANDDRVVDAERRGPDGAHRGRRGAPAERDCRS